MNAKWKVLNAFSAISDIDNKPITVLSVYPLVSDYCGDPFNLLLEAEALEFWQKHIGEIFEVRGDPDLGKLSSEQLRNYLKEKVEFT
jgi:hypothetical protein